MLPRENFRVYLKYFILLVIPLIVFGQVEFKSYRHEFNPDTFKSINVELIDYNKQKSLNGCFVLSQDVNAFTTTVVAMARRRNAKPWVVINATVDSCDFLVNGSKHNFKFFDFIVRRIQSSSPRFPDKCPLEANRDYCFTNFNLDAISLPLKFPNTKFDLTLEYKEKHASFYKIFFVFEIMRQKISF